MLPDLVRCAAETAEIEMRPDVCAGTAKCFLVCIGLNDWELEAALCAGCVPETVRRFLVRCVANRTPEVA